MAAGDIILDLKAKAAWGIESGEDLLHEYKRLLESLDLSSREAAFGARNLQALLASANPEGEEIRQTRATSHGSLGAFRGVGAQTSTCGARHPSFVLQAFLVSASCAVLAQARALGFRVWGLGLTISAVSHVHCYGYHHPDTQNLGRRMAVVTILVEIGVIVLLNPRFQVLSWVNPPTVIAP